MKSLMLSTKVRPKLQRMQFHLQLPALMAGCLQLVGSEMCTVSKCLADGFIYRTIHSESSEETRECGKKILYRHWHKLRQ